MLWLNYLLGFLLLISGCEQAAFAQYNPKASQIKNTPAGNVSSTDVQSAINELDTKKVPTTTTVNGHALSSNVTVSQSDVGLSNVNNTSDANKPVSTAQQSALDLKVDKTTTVNGQPLSSNVVISTVNGNATTATQLITTPTQCSSGYYPRGVDVFANAQNCTQLQPYLGYTPYNATNPSGYISGNQTITVHLQLQTSQSMRRVWLQRFQAV
jgi:hypothetical protein